MHLTDVKELEREANRFPQLKDYKGFGTNRKGVVSKGYHRLKNGKIILLSELKSLKAKQMEAKGNQEELDLNDN